MKFPFIIFFRADKYKDIDQFFITNQATLDCSVYITNNLKKVEKIHDSNNHLLITYGDNSSEYRDQLLTIISKEMLIRHIHMNKIIDIDDFNKFINDMGRNKRPDIEDIHSYLKVISSEIILHMI